MSEFPDPSFESFSGSVVRIVESQEQVATTKIVDTLAEQDALESMLEACKPGQLRSGLHYLLSTPFRYPPLHWGSRFGRRFEPSLFYASLSLETCLRECAYYRFLFWQDMEVPPPGSIETQHTVFRVALETSKCVDLCASTYSEWHDDIRHPSSYSVTHALGTSLRDCGTELLLFASARGEGRNVAAYTPDVFASRPFDQSLWNSQVMPTVVYLQGPEGVFHFSLEEFAGADGRLLRAA